MSAREISVIIPCFNQAGFLAECIRSVLAQTRRCAEIFVVDDGSSDAVEAALEEFGDRVQLFKQQQMGPSSARNHALAKARGEYVAFLDADDRWMPEKIDKQFDLLSTQASLGMVFTAVRLFGEGELSGTIQGAWSGPASLAEIVGHQPVWTPSSVLMRSEVLKVVGGFDTSIRCSEDWDLYIRVAERYQIWGLSEPLVDYRLHSNNASKAMRRMFEGRMTVLDKYERSHNADPTLAAAFTSARRGTHRSLAAGLCAEVKEHWRDRNFVAAAKALAGVSYHDPSFLVSGLRRLARSADAKA